MGHIIPLSEVQFLQRNYLDDVGKVFRWQGRVFRLVLPPWESHVRRLFSSGFVDELVAQRCLPKTWISEYQVDGAPLVLEHESIWPVIYPQEWTFSMLRDAALLVCKAARIAERYNLDMKDCHGHNVLFQYAIPHYCDLGSFVPFASRSWGAYSEFLQFYYYPLKLWRYDPVIGKLTVLSGGAATHDAFLMWRHPWTRRLSAARRRALIRHCLLAPESFSVRRFRCAQQSSHVPSLSAKEHLKKLIRRVIPVRRLDFIRVEREIEAMRPEPSMSDAGLLRDKHEDRHRFQRVAEIITELEGDVRSVVDLGRTQGRLACVLAQNPRLDHVVCVDQDHDAMDRAYNIERTNGAGKITFANYDFLGCLGKLRHTPPNERLRSDVAVVLGLMDNLISTKMYDARFVVQTIADYARKHVIIEFSPQTAVPASTSTDARLDGFRAVFGEVFDRTHQEMASDGGWIFVGTKRNDAPPWLRTCRAPNQIEGEVQALSPSHRVQAVWTGEGTS